MAEEHSFSFRLEGGSLVFDNEEDADLFEGCLIDWVHRGYFEPKSVREGRLTYRLTEFGKEHFSDIIQLQTPGK